MSIAQTAALAERYAEAWGTRDPDAIVRIDGDLIDLAAVEGGQIKSKHSDIDAVTLKAQLGAVATSSAARR